MKKSKTRHCRPWHVIDGAARYLLIPLTLCAEQFIISVCFSLTLYATYSIIFIQSAEARNSLSFETTLLLSIKQNIDRTWGVTFLFWRITILFWRKEKARPFAHQPEVSSRITNHVGIEIALASVVHTYAKEFAMKIMLVSRNRRTTLALFDLSARGI